MTMNIRVILILILAVIVNPMVISNASAADEHSLYTLGDEFLVNIANPDYLRSYTVAPLNDGGFVVVWIYFDGPFSYNCNACVKGQLFDKNGKKNGNGFTIAGQNSHSSMSNNGVKVATLDDGFIVVWEINVHSSQDPVSLGQDIVAQRYDSTGVKKGDWFIVNTSREKDQKEPNVVSLANGGFIAVWKHRAGKDRSIRGQRFTQTGDKEGKEFIVHDATEYMGLPDIAAFTDGGFVVAWQSRDDNTQKVFARRYGPQGNATGDKFRLTTMISGKEGNVTVTSFANGHFMATWDSADGSGVGRHDIYGRIFDTTDTPTGAKFKINQHTAEDQKNPEITSLGDDRAFIVWESAEQDGDGYGVFGRFYTDQGVPNGNELQVNGYSKLNQASPAVSNLPDGSAVVVWKSEADNVDGGGLGRKIKEHQPTADADHEH